MIVRDMLIDAGVPSFLADMAIPFMWFMPGTVDPDSPSIIEINKGMQRALQRLGFHAVEVNGILDRETAAALDEVSPPPGSWMSKTFVQIYGDIERAKKNPERAAQRALALAGFGGYFEYEGVPPGPLPSFRAGTPPGPMGLAGVVDAGVQLDFGRGVRDKSSMVPIPRRSGPTYTAFRRLQRVINRLLSARSEFDGKKPGGRIGEDGVIGSGTFRAFKRVQDAHLRASYPGDTNSAGLAARAISLARILEERAAALGVSSQANRGSSRTRASGDVASAPMSQEEIVAAAVPGEQDDLWKYLSIAALVGGAAWLLRPKKRRARGSR